MSLCPNIHLKEWKDLVKEIGEDAAHLAFQRNKGPRMGEDGKPLSWHREKGDIPTVLQAKEILTNNDAPPTTLEGLRTKLAKGLILAGGAAKDAVTAPKRDGLAGLINDFVARVQLSVARTDSGQKLITKELPTKAKRVAASNWIDMKGDRAAIEAAIKSSKKPSVRRGYEESLKLTPEEIKSIEVIKKVFDDAFERGVKGGVIMDDRYRQDYVTHLIKKAFVGGGEGSSFGGKLIKTFKFGNERTFANFHELEQAGFDATSKDIAHIFTVYNITMDKAIATRRLTRDSLMKKLESGETIGKLINGVPVRMRENEANLIKKSDADAQELGHPMVAEFGDHSYKTINDPAFKNYQWYETRQKYDGDGQPLEGQFEQVLMRGDIGIHTKAFDHFDNMIGRSQLRAWYDSPGNNLQNLMKVAVKSVDIAQSTIKSTMLGGVSPFHLMHEFKRSLPYGVNAFNLPTLDPNNKEHVYALRMGLMVNDPYNVQNKYDEGLGSRSLVDKIPGLGQISKYVSDLTFQKAIPGMKLSAFKNAFAANLKTFAKDIESGKVSKDDVGYLTAQTINSRFGHLNYADLNRDPTFQHILSMAALAPDFWESNIRDYAHASRGLVGAKVGRRPAFAFAATAGAVWMISRVLNKVLDDDYHFDKPFEVIHAGRSYTMRNEAEDLWRATHKTSQYFSGRLSPAVVSSIELLKGTNWRGEKTMPIDVLKDYVLKAVPMSFRAIPPFSNIMQLSSTGKNQAVSPTQQWMSSWGLQISRSSDINDAYKLGSEFKKKQGIAEDTGTYPVSKYQQLRYALEDGNVEKAKEELKKHLATQDATQLEKSFHSSVFREWTGKKDLEQEFMDSLSTKDKETVRKANAKRDAMFSEFQKLIQTAPKSTQADRNREAAKSRIASKPWSPFN